MAIKFRCPQCNKAFSVKDEYVGKKSKCPCGAKITVPEVSSLSNSSPVEPFGPKVAPEPKQELSKQESTYSSENSSAVSSGPAEVAPVGTPAGLCPEKPGTQKPEKPGKIPPRLFWLAILCPPLALFIIGDICTAIGFTVLLISTFGAAWIALAPLTIWIVRGTLRADEELIAPQIEEIKRGESRFCPKCDKAIKIETLACKHCGYKLTEADVIGSLRTRAFLIHASARVSKSTTLSLAGDSTVVQQWLQRAFQRSDTRVLEITPNCIKFEHGSGPETRIRGIWLSPPELLPKRGTVILEVMAAKTQLDIYISENMGLGFLDSKSRRKYKDSLSAWIQEFQTDLVASHSE